MCRPLPSLRDIILYYNYEFQGNLGLCGPLPAACSVDDWDYEVLPCASMQHCCTACKAEGKCHL